MHHRPFDWAPHYIFHADSKGIRESGQRNRESFSLCGQRLARTARTDSITWKDRMRFHVDGVLKMTETPAMAATEA